MGIVVQLKTFVLFYDVLNKQEPNRDYKNTNTMFHLYIILEGRARLWADCIVVR